MAEKLEILKASKKEPQKLINARNEIYGGCRHNTKFHRYTKNRTPSTDDRINPERALGDITNRMNKPTVKMRTVPPPGDPTICGVAVT